MRGGGAQGAPFPRELKTCTIFIWLRNPTAINHDTLLEMPGATGALAIISWHAVNTATYPQTECWQ